MPADASRFTMEDVAALAGVSRASVSRVFLDQGKVSEATKAKVWAAASKLGYVPNVMASQLASGEPGRTLGLLLRDASNPAYGLLFTELQNAAQDADWNLVSMTISRDDEGARQVAALRTLVGMRVRGLIVATGGVSSEQLEPFRTQLPIIRAGRPETLALIHAVSYDETGAATSLADLVWQRGHRRVAVLTTPESVSYPEWIRSTTMTRRLRALGGAVLPVLAPERAKGVSQALAMVADGAASVIMCPSDLWALEVMRAARDRGLRVPEDVSVSGCDGIIPGVDLLGLTTVRLAVHDLARRTVSCLEHVIDGVGTDTVRELVPGQLVPGTTVADLS